MKKNMKFYISGLLIACLGYNCSPGYTWEAKGSCKNEAIKESTKCATCAQSCALECAKITDATDIATCHSDCTNASTTCMTKLK